MGTQGQGSLSTFGGFALSFEGLCLREDENCSKKVWSLLSYLILNRGRDLGVAELYQILWQDKDEENPYGALKTLIFRVRRLLEEAGFPTASMILSSKGIYRWNPEWTMKVDAEEFERLSELCLREDFNMEAGKEQWKEAISLYKGEFLPGAGESVWVMEKRERCSISQFVVLIPSATYENCEAVMTRITKTFNIGDVRKDVAAASCVTAVLPADQDFGK